MKLTKQEARDLLRQVADVIDRSLAHNIQRTNLTSALLKVDQFIRDTVPDEPEEEESPILPK